MRRSRHHHSTPSLAERMTDARAEYEIARTTDYHRRRRGVSSVGHGGDHWIRHESDYLRAMELARYMCRNDQLVAQAVNRRLPVNVLGPGIGVDPKTGNADLDAALALRWRDWTDNADACDVQGKRTWHEMTHVAFVASVRDGDVWGLQHGSGAVEIAEGHRARTPKRTTRDVVNGVRTDRFGKPEEVWFTKDDVAPLAPVNLVRDTVQYQVRDEHGRKQIYQLANADRVSMRRGITALAPAVHPSLMFDDISFAKLVQQQMTSAIAIFRQRAVDAEIPSSLDDPGTAGEHGEQERNTRDDGSTEILEGWQAGLEIFGDPGEKLEGFSANVPNAEFFEHAKLTLTFVAINLDLPLVVLLMDASDANFSAFRSAFDQAKEGFRFHQRNVYQSWTRPAYVWHVARWIEQDPEIAALAAQGGVDPFRAEPLYPSWSYLQPVQDATADALRRERLLTSPRRQSSERGYQWPTLAGEIVVDNGLLIRNAKEEAAAINDEFPDDEAPVSWRDLLNPGSPHSISLSLSAAEPEPERPGEPSIPGGDA